MKKNNTPLTQILLLVGMVALGALVGTLVAGTLSLIIIVLLFLFGVCSHGLMQAVIPIWIVLGAVLGTLAAIIRLEKQLWSSY